MNSVSEESRKCVEKHMEELKGGYKGVCVLCVEKQFGFAKVSA